VGKETLGREGRMRRGIRMRRKGREIRMRRKGRERSQGRKRRKRRKRRVATKPSNVMKSEPKLGSWI